MEADFQSVWSRVNGVVSEEAPETQLRRFLRNEAEDVCILRSILKRTCDALLCRRLTQICTEKTRQIKRLRTALYLLAGECECPAVTWKDDGTELLPTIRALHERVCLVAAAYRKAAAETDRIALETIYASLAEAETRHAASLLECAARLICLSGRAAPI